jgi:hypothetical protein
MSTIPGHPLGSISTPFVAITGGESDNFYIHYLRNRISMISSLLVRKSGLVLVKAISWWIRSLLRNDHRIVLTHGDFHPRNFLVVENEHHKITISGIIDWEMGVPGALGAGGGAKYQRDRQR